MDPARLVAPVAHHAFRFGSRLRSARFFHPRGVVLRGELHVTGQGPLPTGATDCVVRLSKAVGTPGHAPDILGVAFRYADAGRSVDVLLATSAGTHGWRKWSLSPVLTWGRARFTSLLPWESDDGTRALVVGAVEDLRLTTPDVADLTARLPVRLHLRVLASGRELQSGQLIVTGPEAPAPDYDPVLHPPPGWQFVPRWLARVRLASYDGSRRGRPDSVTAPLDDPVSLPGDG